MSKRKRFVVTSLILSGGFIGIQQFVPDNFRFFAIGTLGLLTLILFIWSLWEGLGRDMTLLSLILPLGFTLGVGLFWFLLPASLFARIPVIILFGVGIYALCLTENIYTVSAIRTIALLRAAKGVGFVLTLVTFFLVFDTILSFRWPIYVNSAVVFIVSLPIFLQGFWAVILDKNISWDLSKMSIVASLVVAEISAALFFWPVNLVVGSLFLTLTSYILLGLGQAKLEDRLFTQTIGEYLTLGAAVFIGMFLATKWGS